MKIKEIESRKVITCSGDMVVATAAKQMRDANVGCLIVVNTGSPQGVVTDRDLVIKCLSEAHDPRRCQVSAHMSKPVVATTPDTDILSAAHLMSERRIKRLPVTEHGKVTGVVSLSDIAQAMEQPIHDLLMGMAPSSSVV